MINKNLFICCYKKELLHQKFKDNINKLKEMNPNYNIILHDNFSFGEWYKKINPHDYENYYCKLNQKIGAMIGDYQRQILVYYLGGCYIDIKSNLKIPIDNFISETDETRYFWYPRGPEIAFFFFASISKHPLLKDAIEDIHKKIDNYDKTKINLNHTYKNIIELFGPKNFTKVFNKNNHGVKIEELDYKKFIKYIAVPKYRDYYNLPHYSKVKEYAIL